MEIGNGFHMHIFNMASGTEVEELDSWEDLTDEILERNLAKMKTISTADKQNVEQKPTTVLLDSNDIRSRYLNQTSEPTVKILKRPSPSTNAQPAAHHVAHAPGDLAAPCVNGEATTRPQRKSLQQREAEYAEARLRILGQAHCPEEKELTFQERVRQIQNKPTSPPSTSGDPPPPLPATAPNHITSTLSPQSPVFVSHNHFATATTTILTAPPHFADSTTIHYTTSPAYYTVLPAHIAVGNTAAVLPVGSAAVLAPAKFAPNHVFSNHHHQMRSAQVIRQPRGPDGTRGFQFHQPR